MWNGAGAEAKRSVGLVAVAIDKDRGSQHALKWTTEHLVNPGGTIILIHVNTKMSVVPRTTGNIDTISDVNDKGAASGSSQTTETLLPFCNFCTDKGIQYKTVVLEDADISNALIDYITVNAIENIVVGDSSRNTFVQKFKDADVPTTVSKGAPDFCTVYVISKGAIASVRSASRPAPGISPLQNQIQNQASMKNQQPDPLPAVVAPSHLQPGGSNSDDSPKKMPRALVIALIVLGAGIAVAITGDILFFLRRKDGSNRRDMAPARQGKAAAAEMPGSG